MTRTIRPPKPSIYDLSSEEIANLAKSAVEAKSKAYCPYSQFPVGAALLLSNGTYHTGANVEIASSPVGICAERCALAPVIASYTRSQHYTHASNADQANVPSTPERSEGDEDLNLPVIRGLAVSTNIDPPSSPCGMCRQFIREFCGEGMKVWMYGGRWDRGERDDGAEDLAKGKGKVVEVKTIGELLPMSFSRRDLERGRDREG